MNKMAVKGHRGNDINMPADEVPCTPGHLQRNMRSFYRCPKMLNHMTEHAALVKLAPSVLASWASRVSSTLSYSLLNDLHTYSSTSTPDDDGHSNATAIFSHSTHATESLIKSYRWMQGLIDHLP